MPCTHSGVGLFIYKEETMGSPNVYKRHTKLNSILLDGWSMGFQPEQTLREASAAGYALCVVEPQLNAYWGRLDAEVNAFMDAHPPTSAPDPFPFN